MSHPSHLHQQRASELIAQLESKIYQIPRSHYPKQEDLRVARYRRRERTLAVTENVLVPSLKHTAMNSLAIKNKIRGSWKAIWRRSLRRSKRSLVLAIKLSTNSYESQNSWGVFKQTQSFLTVLFASLLCFNRHEQVTAAAGRHLVCELRYHWLRIGTKKSNLIEKKVSRRTEKSSKPHRFSPFFLSRGSFLINSRGRRQRWGENGSVSRDIKDGGLAPKIAI